MQVLLQPHARGVVELRVSIAAQAGAQMPTLTRSTDGTRGALLESTDATRSSAAKSCQKHRWDGGSTQLGSTRLFKYE
eukprot:596076-Pelagomonas_calceolata.AAC.2